MSRTNLHPVSAQDQQEYHGNRPIGQRHKMLIFIAMLLFVPLLGLSIITLNGPSVEHQAFANLEAIAKLKASQIVNWLHERQADGMVFTTDRGFIKQVAALSNGNEHLRDHLLSRLQAVRQAYRYDAVTLLDSQGRVLLEAGTSEPLPADMQALLADALTTGQTTFGNLSLYESGHPHMDVIAPLLSTVSDLKVPVGVVVLHQNPENFLFPYIQEWPTPSLTGETLLIRREGESVVYLNELRYSKATAFRLRFPLSSPQLPSAVALRTGLPGITKGHDYRGTTVLAAFRPVPGTDWMIVAKIDREEVLASLTTLILWVSLISFVSVAILAIAGLMLWHQQQRMGNLALQVQKAEADRLLRHFFEMPFIGMAMTSPATKAWLRFNDQLCFILGYPREELAKKNWAELTHPDDLQKNLAEYEHILRGESEGYRMDKRFIRKDGSVVYAAIDVKCVRTPSGAVDCTVTTIEDITDRKQAEAKLQRLTNLYAALSQCNEAIVRCQDEDGLFQELCRIAVVFGQMKMAWIGIIDPQTHHILPVAHFGDGAEYLHDVQITVEPDSPLGHGPTGTSVQENRPFWCQDFVHDPATQPWHEQGARFGWGASAALPLHRNGMCIGAFTLYASVANSFDEAAQNLLLEMAFDINFALEKLNREAERKRIEETLHEREQRLGNIFEQAGDGIFVITDDFRFVDSNAAGLGMLGYNRDELQQLRLSDVLVEYERPRLDVEVPVMMDGIPHIGEWEHLRKDGTKFYAEVNAKKLSSHQFLAIVRDLTRRKEAEARIRWLAHFDTLTGLANRTLLNDRAGLALGRAQRDGKPVALMCLDLDHFKHINDTLGQSIGDEFLVEIGRRIQATVREEDTVSRQGGDDFILVLPDTDAEGAMRVVENLLLAVACPYQIDEHELVVTPSIGIAMFPGDGCDFNSLAKNADVAMYRAKKAGRNTHRFFKEEMQAHSARVLQLENGLRRTLERGELHLHYQPQLSIDGCRVIGAEALLRWHNPVFGTVSPAEFIPIAEHSGQIVRIGEWVLRTAIRQMKRWQDNGLAPMVIAVNLSVVQFRHPDLPSLVSAILEEEGMASDCLELELTEAVTMDDPLQAIKVMDDLYQRGIRLSIDDFGTGYSSLSYLKRFPVYKLKIDQSFVRNMAEHTEDKAIVNAIINLAQNLGLKTIAEGVETAEQLALLRENGCNEVQGYFFSKPLPASQFEAFWLLSQAKSSHAFKQ